MTDEEKTQKSAHDDLGKLRNDKHAHFGNKR